MMRSCRESSGQWYNDHDPQKHMIVEVYKTNFAAKAKTALLEEDHPDYQKSLKQYFSIQLGLLDQGLLK